MDELVIDSASPAEGVVCLAVVGEVDMESVGSLHDALQAALLTPGLAQLLLDLKGITFLDSAGIHALVTGHRQAGEMGVTFRVVNASVTARRVLAITGVLAYLTGEP